MRMLPQALCLLASGSAALAQASGAGSAWEAAYPVSGYTSAEGHLRDAPSTPARVLTVIPAGALAYRDTCTGGRCYQHGG